MSGPLRAVSRLAADLAAGRFVVTSEVVPPASARLGAFFRRAAALSRFARAITVTNNHGGTAQLGSLTAAGLLVRQGIEPIWVCITRDQNRLAIESDLISAEALDVRNILCLRGDEFPEGVKAKPVHDLGTFGLIRLVAARRDAGAPFFVGAAVDLNSVPAERAAEQAARRVEAGAEFLLTQPVYEAERVEAFLEALRPRLSRPVWLLPGMMPLLSRDAVERVPGRLRIVIAEHILSRIREAADPKREGLAVFAETLRALRSIRGVHGVNLMLFGFRPDIAEEVRATIATVIQTTPYVGAR
ncbi:MAG: methylenetetrahydrofolate reductase [Chloroflexota bacterium]|nr:methylenetetrahydrofolate reductase [Chloroflexota bacterium]